MKDTCHAKGRKEEFDGERKEKKGNERKKKERAERKKKKKKEKGKEGEKEEGGRWVLPQFIDLSTVRIHQTKE